MKMFFIEVVLKETEEVDKLGPFTEEKANEFSEKISNADEENIFTIRIREATREELDKPVYDM